jgi:hypothetical protein
MIFTTPSSIQRGNPSRKHKVIRDENSIELSGRFQIADAVFERRRTPAEVNCCVPITAVGHRYPRRQHFEMPPVTVVRPAALETLKVCVAHYSHIALMRALNDNDVASVEIFTVVDETHDWLLKNEGRS